jgi:hypothetical protein
LDSFIRRIALAASLPAGTFFVALIFGLGAATAQEFPAREI